MAIHRLKTLEYLALSAVLSTTIYLKYKNCGRDLISE
jgi:hypothetical protein